MRQDDYFKDKNITIAIIGLGYVGLPLAVAFANHYSVIGYDIDGRRIDNLNIGDDITQGVSKTALQSATKLRFTSDARDLEGADVYIVTVPTPITASKEPELTLLINACGEIGKYLVEGNLVIFESTVYPGATEITCIPVLEKRSGLKLNKDFYVGYSPERINPGDKTNTLASIKKVTSGSNEFAANIVDGLYSQIIDAGTHKAPSIMVAEASKILENTQRDVNIGLVNEFSQICERLGIDTLDVIQAAETKWNFAKYTPGLVGGHCIGVDPYYLIHRAKGVGYTPTIINSARIVNEEMVDRVAEKVIFTIAKRKALRECRALILGISFKENCPDLRNSKVPELVCALEKTGISVDILDPIASPDEVKKLYGMNLIDSPKNVVYDTLIFAVPHDKIVSKGISYWKNFALPDVDIFDLKRAFPKNPNHYTL